MTKTDLIHDVADQAEMTKRNSEAAVTAMFDAISEALAEGEKVTIVGFGTFEVRERTAREGINPRTKERLTIPASRLPAFKAGKALKDAVANG